MFTTNKAHDIAFVKGPDAKLHHVGFHVDELHDVFKAADILSMYEVPFDVTPTRHGITRGKTIYSLIHLETVTKHLQDGYMAFADMPTITWKEEKIGKGIFYHRRELSESFAKALT